MASFEVFGRQRATLPVPYVSIHSRGVIALNSASWLALNKPDAVELLYDRDSNRMGLRAGDPNDSHTYQLRGVGDGTSRTLSGTAFFQYYGIPYGVAQRFPARIEAGMLIVDLDNPEPIPHLPRLPGKRRSKHFPTRDP